MEDYDDLLSDGSDNEEAYYSDQIDSDIEAELYGLIHHDTQDNSVSLQDKSDSVDINSVSIQDKSDSEGINSVSIQDKSGSTENNSILLQDDSGLTDNNSVLPVTNPVASVDTINSTERRKNRKKKLRKNSFPITNDHTSFFSSDAIVNSNLYYSFESPVPKQKQQHNQVQNENTKRNVIPTPAKRKSDAISEILENIQCKKNIKSAQPENSVSKQKKNKPNHNCIIAGGESFVEIIDDSSESDSDSSIIFLEPDQSNLQTNIAKETVVLSSDSEDSDSSMEKSFSQACQRKQAEVSNADISPNSKDPWHINSEDKFRTRKQSNRYHDNAVMTCSKCQLKGHSAKFCTISKAMKCFFCGDYHSGMNCKNKICTKCFQQGHDRRRCYVSRPFGTCGLCGMRGHSLNNCPDLWRRYHLTTSKGSIVKGNPKPHSPLYCYTCGSKGHYGAECVETRTDRWSFPTWTSVISYKNPISVLRNKDGRNFQQEERNSNERNRFDETPLFRRRKRNDAFSKDTPIQKTKQKKKKKSKMQPNTNPQSATRSQSIIHNEVYFPRTPKMTPSSSTEHFPKKKLKKLKNGRDALLRQQMMHRIGLQQRLGLSFPSTI